MSEEKKRKNLATYAVCMVLAVIILILFAAMADNREQHFENQINEKEQVNMNIQNQIVSLSDENYNLKKEAEENNKALEEKDKELVFYQTVTKVWELQESGDTANAEEAFASIDPETLTETQRESYDALKTTLNK
ncbi:MAG: hypothetical protein U0L92_00265 [Clostridia bacterium]|nr:hypothetical protein [Clostridia bacterium]